MRVLYCRAQPTACEVDLSSPAVCAELLWVVIARGGYSRNRRCEVGRTLACSRFSVNLFLKVPAQCISSL